jgi:hypothetical protein
LNYDVCRNWHLAIHVEAENMPRRMRCIPVDSGSPANAGWITTSADIQCQSSNVTVTIESSAA